MFKTATRTHVLLSLLWASTALAGPDPQCGPGYPACDCGTCVNGQCLPCNDNNPCTLDLCGYPDCAWDPLPDCEGDGLCDERDTDDDNDGIPDCLGLGPCGSTCTGGNTIGCKDNCPCSVNPDQADLNINGIGDVCEQLHILYVDADSTAADPTGASWSTAFPHLQDALLKAYLATTGQYEIWVAEGVYAPDEGGTSTPGDPEASFDLVDAVAVYGGFVGGEASRTARDPRAHTTTLSGLLSTPSQHAYHVVRASEVGPTAVLDGFTIRDGVANLHNGWGTAGGGLLVGDAAPTIANCTFESNTAQTGGALFVSWWGSQQGPHVVNCVFRDNHATEYGGAVFTQATPAQFVNGLFYHNSATLGGGAIYALSLFDPDVALINCTIYDNYTVDSAGLGGGVFSDLLDPPGMTITNSIIWGNSDSSPDGSSAQIIQYGAPIAVTYCNIQGPWSPGAHNVFDNPFPPTRAGCAPSPCAGSTALSAGNVYAIPADIADLNQNNNRTEPVPYDLLGLSRTDSYLLVDMGAIQASAAECPQQVPALGTCRNQICNDPLYHYCCWGSCKSGPCCRKVNGGACAAGEQCCPGQERCCPDDGVCCGAGCCAAGQLCVDDQCVSLPGSDTCGNCTNEDHCCTGEGRCCALGESCCGSSACCGPGEFCQDGVCAAAESPFDLPTRVFYGLDNRGTKFLVPFLQLGDVDPIFELDYGFPELYLTSETPTIVHIQYPATGTAKFRATVALTPNTVRRIILPENVYHDWQMNAVNNNAVLLTSDAEFACVMSSIQLESSDASLVLPVDAWGQEYVLATPYGQENWSDRPILAIVANVENTSVEIIPTARLQGRLDTAPFVIGPLDAGMAYTTRSDPTDVDHTGDLSGTIIRSLSPAKPILVVYGHEITNWPVSKGGGEGFFLVGRPTRFAYEHAIVPELTSPRTITRPDSANGTPVHGENWLLRKSGSAVVGTTAGTLVTINPRSQPNLGEVDLSAEGGFHNEGVTENVDACGVSGSVEFLANSEHPIQVTEYVLGSQCDEVGLPAGTTSTVGDPAMEIVAGTDQFASYHIFRTIGSDEGATDEIFYQQREYDSVCVWTSWPHWAHSVHITAHESEIDVGYTGVSAILLDGTPIASNEFLIVNDGPYYVTSQVLEPGVHTIASPPEGPGHGAMVLAQGDRDSCLFSAGDMFERWMDTIPPAGECIAVGAGGQAPFNCTVTDNFSEDLWQGDEPPNGQLDANEDTPPANGFLDVDSGIHLIAKGANWHNLKLVNMVGDERQRSFTVDVVDSNESASGDILVFDRWGNKTTVPIVVANPVAQIKFLSGQDVIVVADECQVVTVSAADSIANAPSGLLFEEWDLSDPQDFTPVDAYAESFVYSWRTAGKADCEEGECEQVPVSLYVENDLGAHDDETKSIIIHDLKPVAISVIGPSLVRAGQRACYTVTANSRCDDIASWHWDFEANVDEDQDAGGDPFEPEVGQQGGVIDSAILCTSFATAGSNVMLGARAADSDGDTITSPSLAIVVVEAGLPFERQEEHLTVRTKYFSYAPLVVSQQVAQRFELELANPSGSELIGPFYVTFEDVTPAAAELVGDLDGTAGAVPQLAGQPHLAVPSEGRLKPDETTESISVEWRLPEGATDAFAFKAVAYSPPRPPSFIDLPTEPAFEGFLYEAAIRAEDPDSEPVYYELVGSVPVGMVINAATGVITWIPDELAGAQSPYTITARASDGHTGSHVDATFEIEVVAINKAPTITSIPRTLAPVNQEYEYMLAVDDVDGDTLDIEFTTKPDVAVFDTLSIAPNLEGNWVLAWTPKWESEGHQDPLALNVHISIDDQHGAVVVQDFTVYLTTCANLPLLAQIPDDSADEDLPYLRQIQFEPGSDIAPAYFAIINPPEGMLVSSEGLIQWRPSYQDHGTRLVKVAVSSTPYDFVSTEPDNRCTDTMVYRLTVNDRNAEPSLRPIETAGPTEGELFLLDVNATDQDGDTLKFELRDAPDDMRINPLTGVIAWTPSQFAKKVYPNGVSFTVRVSDPLHYFDEAVVALGITEVDVPPVFMSSPRRTAFVLEPYDYLVRARDPDDPTDPPTAGAGIARYTYTIDPEDSAFQMVDQSSGLITFNPGLWAFYVGSPYRVQITAEDTTHQTAVQSFDLKVLGSMPVTSGSPPGLAFTQPPLNYVIADPSEVFAADVDVTDPDQPEGEPFFYEIAARDVSTHELPVGDGPTFTNNVGTPQGHIAWTPDPENAGRVFTIVARVIDVLGNSSALTHRLVILSPREDNYPPVQLSQPLLAAQVDVDYVYEIEVADPDLGPTGKYLTFELVPTVLGAVTIPPPSGMTLDDGITTETKQSILWRPDESQVGTHWVSYRVSDEVGSSFVDTYKLAVSYSGGNRPPAITSAPNSLTASVGSSYSYPVTAVDLDANEILRFSVNQAPAGATINRSSGLLTWVPLANQTGGAHIRVRVTDSRGAYDEQIFDIGVSEDGSNRPPTIVSSPNVDATLGVDYVYTVDFSDPNGHAVVLTIEDGPSTLTWNPATFELSWLQSNLQSGIHPVRLRVTDTLGAFSEQVFSINVYEADNTPPVFNSSPPSTVQVGEQMTYILSAYDLGDPTCSACEFWLETYPSGVSRSNATITWTPTALQAGANRFLVRVKDEDGAWGEQAFEVTVSQSGTNHAPKISSVPPERAAQGVRYEYRVAVNDPDRGDLARYEVLEAPSLEMVTFDPRDPGLLVWDAPDSEGTFDITIRVHDHEGATDEQSFAVTVSADQQNRPPRIVTRPIVTVASQNGSPGWSYVAKAVDPDGDPLTWPTAAFSGPPGMIVVPNGDTATITWTPAVDAHETRQVVLRVQDGEYAYDEQEFLLYASPDGSDLPPVIRTAPVTRVVAGYSYEYVAEGTDPEGTTVRFSLPSDQSPPTMTTTPAGAVSWLTTTPSDIGRHAVVLRATDANGAGLWSEQKFHIDVVDNQPLRITSTPTTYAVANIPYSYQIEVEDPDEHAFGYTLQVNPAGSNLSVHSTSGLLSGTPAEGDYDVTITVSSALDATEQDSQTFRLRVARLAEGDSTDPLVEIAVDDNPVAKNGSPSFTILASDDIGLAPSANPEATITITDPLGVSSAPFVVALDADGTTGFSPSYVAAELGVYRVAIEVTDLAGKGGTSSTDFYVVNIDDADEPIAEITRPLPEIALADNGGFERQLLTGPTVFSGRAWDYRFYKYTLSYAPVDAVPTTYTVFATGYEPVGDANETGELGTLDTKMLANGDYIVRLSVWDTLGHVAHASKTFTVAGDLKVGNFTMSFEDMSVPVAGLPISIVRTYDSRVKTRGDFGTGWKLEFSSIKVRESTRMDLGWYNSGGKSGWECEASADGSHSVSLTWPDGRTEVFEMEVDHEPSGLQGGTGGSCPDGLVIYSVGFRLTSPGTSLLQILGEIPTDWNASSASLVVDPSDDPPPRPWQPEGYLLTTPDGTKYEFHRASGYGSAIALTNVIDRNGNTITFSRDGVEHSSGLGVHIVRNAAGRILQVIDPEQNVVEYKYDANSNLTRVIDQVGRTTTFRYNLRNELYEILDPRGIPVAKNVYDDDGRLIETRDAEGYSIQYKHDEGKETIIDRLGVETEYYYDEKGRVTQEVADAGDNGLQLTTWHRYDSRDNLITTLYPEPDPDGSSANPNEDEYWLRIGRTYNDYDSLLTDRDVNGNVTTYTYGNFQQITTVEDPLHRLSTYHYDDAGNLTRLIDPNNKWTVFTPDNQGNIKSTSTPANTSTSQTYDDNGYLIESVDALGKTTRYENDLLGRPVKTMRTRSLPDWQDGGADTEQVVTQAFYDNLGRVVRTIDPLGWEAITTYNAIGKQETVTDPSGTTRYAYDARGNLTATTYADDSTTRTIYDANGRSIASKDRDDNWSWVEYDALGRQVRTYASKYETGEPSYPCGESNYPCSANPLAAVDRTYSATEYDGMGRVKRQYEQPYGGSERNQTLYTYLANSRVVTVVTGTLSHSTTYEYDKAGQLTSVVDANSHQTRYEYDNAGRQIQTIFHDGTSAGVGYDDDGRKTSETDPDGKTTHFEYDEAGQLEAVVDATGRGRTVYEYDDFGNRTIQRDAEGRETKMAYDSLGRLIKRLLPMEGPAEYFAYDVAGNRTSHQDFNGDVTTYLYDVNNRLTTKVLPYTLFGTAFSGILGGQPVAGTIDFTFYSDSGAPDHVVIAGAHTISGPVTISVVDDENVLFSSPATQGGTFELPPWIPTLADRVKIEAGDLVLRIEQGAEHIDASFVGRSPAVIFDYSTGGLRTQAGEDTYEYDDRGRLTRETKASGDSLTYAYNEAANQRLLTTHHGAESASVRYHYDDLSRLERVSDDGDATYTVYTYDPVGNRGTVTYPNMTQAVYAYDPLNRLSTLTNQRDAADPSPVPFSIYAYKVGPAGNRNQVQDTYEAQADNRQVDYGYDALYRLTSETISEMNGAVIEYVSRNVEYTYDRVGNRSTMKVIQDDNQGFVTQTLVKYEYDANDRLTRSVSDTDPISFGARDKFDRYYGSLPRGWTRPAVLAFGGLCLTAFWAPLVPWRRIRARSASPRTKPSGSSALPLGRRARRKRLFTACVTTFLVPLMAVDPNAVQAMNTEALRVQTAITAGVVLNADPTVTETTYTYDANGNQIGRQTVDPDNGPVSETYIFDAENQLVGYRKTNDGVLNHASSGSYSYDADGIRVSKTTANATTLYLTDKQQPYAQVIEERNAAGELRARYTYGDDLIRQHRRDGSAFVTRYFHYDGQMSTRQLTDDDALPNSVDVTDRYTYDAFGVGVSLEGTSSNAYLYTGEQYDEVLGNYYLRARYYGQAIGRFVSRDLFEGVESEPLSLHKYLYAHNSPVDRIDPSGLFSLVELAVVGVFTGILFASVARIVQTARGKTQAQIESATMTWFYIGLGVGLGTYLVVWAIASYLAVVGLAPFLAERLSKDEDRIKHAFNSHWDKILSRWQDLSPIAYDVLTKPMYRAANQVAKRGGESLTWYTRRMDIGGVLQYVTVTIYETGPYAGRISMIVISKWSQLAHHYGL